MHVDKLRYLTTTLEGFVQQIMTLADRGYWFYTTGTIPVHKVPTQTDRRLIKHYRLNISKYQRCRYKAQGRASVQYLRYERQLVILATKGRHPFFSEQVYYDFHKRPLKIGGYSIRVQRKTVQHGNKLRQREGVVVGISQEAYQELKAYYLELAKHRSTTNLVRAFQQFPLEYYGGVKTKAWKILELVNRQRKRMNYEPVLKSQIDWKRRPVRVFE